MAGFVVKNMGGMVPRLDPGQLPDNMAELAVDCDFRPGSVEGLRLPQFLVSLPGAKKAYRFPNAEGTDVAWLPLPSPYSSVVRSPLTNDTHRRVYWTNPGDPYPWWSTWQALKDGVVGPYELGIAQPDPAHVLGVTATGGTPPDEIPWVGRSYVYTFLNAFGEESAPSTPSPVVEGAADGTWTISGIPTAPPAAAGRQFLGVTQVRLYRTVTGLQTGASYYEVRTWDYTNAPPPASGVYVDTSSDLEIVDRQLLQSTNWGNPPEGLDGLVALPGGMLVGFIGNTIHFCEPYRPHAWPAIYDQSVLYDIVALAVWQQSLVVLTKGFPSTGSGNSPVNYVLTSVQVSEPCIARGSVVVDLAGVLYASQNGIILLNYYGMTNATLEEMTKNVWLERYKAETLIACRHRSQYFAINEDEVGFLFDGTDKRMGFVDISRKHGVTAIWNDEYNGDTLMLAYGAVYLWDGSAAPLTTFHWKSKQFYSPKPLSLGAVHTVADRSIRNVLPPQEACTDPSLVLPPGVNAQFRIYAGPDLVFVMLRNLTKPTEIFRLPSGFEAFEWQIELVSRVRFDSVELATTMKALAGVG